MIGKQVSPLAVLTLLPAFSMIALASAARFPTALKPVSE
jgi:hypothetical protein